MTRPGAGAIVSGMLPVRVVVAHHEPLMRGGLRALLEREDDIDVVGEVASGEELGSRVSELEPDVVVVDAALPGRCDALTATRRIVAARAEVGVLVLGPAGCDDALFRALRAGAGGFLERGAAPPELPRAVRSLAAGDAVLSPSLTRRLIDEFVAQPDPCRPDPARLAELTPREREVMGLAALGLTNDEIALRLVVSPATAKTHVSRAMLKLHARDRAQLVALAYQSRFVEPPARPPLALVAA
jgi:DNA-binding NarL/FixJ family response regulator